MQAEVSHWEKCGKLVLCETAQDMPGEKIKPSVDICQAT